MFSPTSTAPVAPVCKIYIYIDCLHFIYYIIHTLSVLYILFIIYMMWYYLYNTCYLSYHTIPYLIFSTTRPITITHNNKSNWKVSSQINIFKFSNNLTRNNTFRIVAFTQKIRKKRQYNFIEHVTWLYFSKKMAAGGGGGGAGTNFSFSVSPRWRLYMNMEL